jgi:hypothetical protein
LDSGVKRVLTSVLACAALAATSTPAHARPGQVSIFQHDAILRGSGDEARAKALDALGVDVVKVLLNWRNIAPGGNKKPEGFNAADPAAYDPAAWAPYDDLAGQARARGMRVFFALGGLAPDWASSGTKHSPGAGRPNPYAFRDFVEAAGRRYSGSYVVGSGSAPAPAPPEDPEMPLPLPAQATPAQAGSTLPRVGMWSVWNEPNLSAWLAPQNKDGRPFAPHHYRRLLKGARSGLRETGHGKDTLLIGELAPYGSHKQRLRPLRFLRELACVDRRFRPFRGKAARKRGCRGPGKLPGTGFAIHPYTLAGGPDVQMQSDDDVTIGYLGRLTRTLNRLDKLGRFQRRRMPVWITEFGFQTYPPDPFQTSIGKVPRFMGLSEWIAYRNSRVASHAQYLLYDDEDTGGFQTGIRFSSGKAKPGVYSAYRLPFFAVQRGSRKVEVWGAVRAAGKGRTVTIQSRRGKRWRKLGTAKTTARGYFRKTFRVSSPGKRKYRFKGAGRTSVQLSAARR